MDEKALFMGFWTHESGTTLKVLGRSPDESGYRPDRKSRTAQEIAWQIICEEPMIIEARGRGSSIGVGLTTLAVDERAHHHRSAQPPSVRSQEKPALR